MNKKPPTKAAYILIVHYNYTENLKGERSVITFGKKSQYDDVSTNIQNLLENKNIKKFAFSLLPTQIIIVVTAESKIITDLKIEIKNSVPNFNEVNSKRLKSWNQAYEYLLLYQPFPIHEPKPLRTIKYQTKINSELYDMIVTEKSWDQLMNNKFFAKNILKNYNQWKAIHSNYHTVNTVETKDGSHLS